MLFPPDTAILFNEYRADTIVELDRGGAATADIPADAHRYGASTRRSYDRIMDTT
jgi:hypothetical protein